MSSLDEEEILDAIAVIGMAGRFPDAPDLARFWRNLEEGVESIRPLSDEELLAAGVSPARLSDPGLVKAGTTLDGVELFDAPFFGFNPREAEILDPQQRFLLEVAWTALENAGYDAPGYPGRIGVYVSGRISDYFLRNLSSNPELMGRMSPLQVQFGNDKDYFATLVSYKLNLRGPSVSVQTACSSSLVAVHLACESVLNGQCDMALAGGVAINLPQRAGYFYQPGGVFSPDGHCRAFDADGAGTVFGSGVGLVVLKRLDRALADGDSILAVVRGSAINNDGSQKVGFSAPSENGQAGVIAEALEVAGIHPESIGYVEAHGTGTQLGDPIEIAALSRVFRKRTDRQGFCAIGSVKTNIGHLESAAGIAGLIKAVLTLRNGAIPPSLNFRRPNPNIDFASSPFYVNVHPSPWPANGHPRRAGVSSFGMGGTNAHVVLEEAPPAAAPSPSRPWQLVVLSARGAGALDEAAGNLVRHLEDHPGLDPADVAWTLQTGRKALPQRRMVVCRSLEDARQALAEPDPRRVLSGVEDGERPVAFLFPGQGSQFPGMGEDLYRHEPVFRELVDRSARTLQPLLGFDLRRVLFPEAGEVEEARARLDRTAVTQPALFTVEYALAQLLRSWGVVPECLLGHSIGEYVAACLAGVFTLEEALTLVAERGRLMEGLPPGAMLAVSLPAEQVAPWLGADLDLAAVNGPSLCSVAGPPEAIDALAAELGRRGVENRRLHTSHAFHSRQTEPVLERFAEAVGRVALQPPRIPFVSNLTGTWIEPAEATDPAYWVRHLRGTVLFARGAETLLERPQRILLEVGPGRSLATLARQAAKAPGTLILPALRAPRDEGSDLAALLTAVGRLWLTGVPVDWKGLHSRERRRRLPLPTYPFERRRYWIEPRGTLVRQTVLADAPALVDGPAAEEETALVLHGRPELPGAYVAPRTDTERGVLRIWQELLGIEAIGVHDSFFELGGHSLLLVQVLARLRDVFRVELPLRSVAAAATVAELALEVEEAEAGFGTASSVPALRADPEGRYEPFPLTEVQEAYWIGRSGVFQLGNVATHQYFEIERESLDLDRFTLAWRRIIDRHDMMRAVMLPDGRQKVLAEVPPYEIEVLDVRGLPPAEAEARIDEVRRQMSHQVIPADRWPLFEIRATRMDGGRFRLHLSLDLLIADAWSVELLKLELADFYADPEAVRPPLDLRFRDCVLSEVAFRESESYRLATEYWLDRLPSLPGAPELPLAKNPAELTRPRFVRRRGALEEPDWSRLKARAARAGLTPSGILLAVYSEVLGTWSKSPRFLLNLTVFNRPPIHPQITQVVGDFTSLSLLEVDLAASATFEEGARSLQARLWEDLDHRAVSGVRVQRERMRREGGVTGAMAPVVFTSVMNLPGSEDEAPPGVTAADLLGQDPFAISQTPQVWIDHVATERYGILLFTWDAVEDLFPPGVLQALFEAYCALLERLAREEAAWSEGHLRLLPEPQHRVREAVNATEAALPAGLLHEPVAAQAALRSAAPAVIASGRTLSYGELHSLANRVAWRLREEGARPNRLVAVVMEKGWEQVVAVLGILRSGAAYLPVDPALPEERLRYLLEQGEADLALTQARWDAELPWPSGVRRLVLSEEEFAAWPEGDLEPVQGPDDLAYVIFTSGTTGLPKGVAIDHRGAANTVADVNQRFAVGPDDRVLALSSLSFDLSVYDIFGLLSAGGALVLPDPGASREPAHWLDRMARHGVTLWNTVPALLKMLVDSISGRAGLPAVPLRLVLLSGDWIPVPLPDQVRTVFPGSRVISLGGATEASIWSILYPVGEVDPAWTSIPYGRPMANQRFHVLNDLLEPCPDWVPGQLYIGGAGLARGYWRDPEKTAASFFVHPRTGERLYRTGDLGRWLPGGEIEFLGREDSQVKVQGYRIELGEIETVLVRHPAVREAVVAAVGDPRGEKRLIAYVVPEERRSAEAAFDPFAAEEGEGLGLLRDPLERLEFKTREPGLRPEEDREAIELPRREADEDRVRPYRERRSHRRFRPEAVPFGQLGELLGCLGLLEVDGKVRYRYPSAGSLYPVQVYVAVKPGRVEGVAGGAYYFHPRHRHLVRLSEGVLDARLFGPENAPVFDRSAFALFLVGQLQAIAPIYGSRARDFCLLEAGYMSQLLMTSAPASRIGLCPIGTLYFEPLRRLFALEESHEFLHALVGGGLDETPAGAGDDYDLFLQLLHEEAGERAAVALAAPPAGALQVDADLVREVREMLAAQLPDYMIPSGFVALESLPLSPNGKVDRRALPLPGGGGEPGEEHVSPRDEVEERAAAIWGEVLGVERVGVHDNFFREGGHSLLAARLIARLREEFQVELPLAALFEAPTVAGLAAALRRGRPAGAAPAEGLPALVPAPDSRYEPFPLSDLQEAYWVGRSGEIELGASPLYYLELDIPGLDLERLGNALRRLIERHDMLRASVLPDGRQQILREAAPCEIAFADLRDVAEGERQTALDGLRQRLAVEGPRVDRPPLLEVAVARLDERRSRLFLSVSLLICDAWSFRIFSGELARLYADPGAELPALELSFRDYVLALAGLQKTAAYRRSEEYWWRRLETLPPAPELPLALNPASIARSRMVRRAGSLPAEAWQRFKEQAARFGVTADAALGTAYAQVIGTWSKSRRFTLNVLYFNRLDLHPQVGALLGNFSSTLLLEVDPEGPEPFEARARRLQQQLWNDIEHGHVTGVRVLRELNRRQGRGARTAMPVVFASTAGLGQGGRGEEPRAAMVGEPVESRLQTPQVWLDHQVFETGGTVSFNWDAVEELFPPGLIQAMFDAYCALLARLAEGEAAWSGVLPSLVPEAQLALRAAANATDEPLLPGRLDELFTAQAARRPAEPAVLASGRPVTYGELDASAERIARILRRQGAERDRLVAVVMDRGWEQVAAVLGVLRAGAAYLPLSPALPRERLWQLLDQAEVEAVLTQPAVEERLSWPSGVRRIPVDESLLQPVNGERLSPVGGPEDLAYVIFTSGSTGLPKGVMIEHRSAVNTVLDMNRRFGIGPDDRILAVSSLSFDLSVYDLFGPLAAGGAVVLLDEEETREPVRWLDKIERDRVTVWNSVPALLEMLADEVESRSAELPGSLRLVLLSGDWIPVTLPGRIHALQPEARVVSLGGATEASIWSILFPIEEVGSSWTSIPYGRPMANQRFHVLNDSLEPCPVWVPGQLFIAGAGLARGYWRNEDATRASFFVHPGTGERLYRTGDLGRYLPDGTIEFLGREDFQVKIQGYRIELEEIDAALVRHPGVRAGVTVAVGEKRGSKRLAAFIVPEAEGGPTSADLSAFLAEKLPAYMVPHGIVALDELPLTANGKVDRGALAEMGSARPARSTGFVAPRDRYEERLAAIWEEILEVRPVGVSDDFFALGGHSLLGVRLMARIRAELGRDLPLAALLEGPTVEHLAALLARAEVPGRTSILVPLQRSGERAPLFLVHPVGGSVLCYGELARALGDGQPCYGLQVPEGQSPAAASVEEMAARYVEAVRSAQPAGPYRLGGWSMGGVVAFEMARQMRADGEEVELLVLLDVPAAEGSAPAEMDDADLLAWFARDLGELSGVSPGLDAALLRTLPPGERLPRLLEAARRAGALPSDVEAEGLERHLETFKSNAGALLRYRPQPYPGSVLLVLAEESAARNGDDPSLGWSALTGGGVEVRRVPGNHYTVVRQPGVSILAKLLRERLEGEAP